MTECPHTITRGRTGERGSWCDACGVQIMAIHDRPCSECKHYQRIGHEGFGGSSTCRKLLMAVTRDLRVTYRIAPIPGQPGLCFEQATDEEKAKGVVRGARPRPTL